MNESIGKTDEVLDQIFLLAIANAALATVLSIFHSSNFSQCLIIFLIKILHYTVLIVNCTLPSGLIVGQVTRSFGSLFLVNESTGHAKDLNDLGL